MQFTAKDWPQLINQRKNQTLILSSSKLDILFSTFEKKIEWIDRIDFDLFLTQIGEVLVIGWKLSSVVLYPLIMLRNTNWLSFQPTT